MAPMPSLLGTFEDEEAIAAYIKPFGISLRQDEDTGESLLEIKGLGQVNTAESGLLLFSTGAKASTLVLLASNANMLPELVNLIGVRAVIVLCGAGEHRHLHAHARWEQFIRWLRGLLRPLWRRIAPPETTARPFFSTRRTPVPNGFGKHGTRNAPNSLETLWRPSSCLAVETCMTDYDNQLLRQADHSRQSR